MREGIVKEISDVVMDKVKANNFDVVFDKSGMSLNGVPIIMFPREFDFTSDVVAVLNKPGRVTEPVASPAASRRRSPNESNSGEHTRHPARVFFCTWVERGS